MDDQVDLPEPVVRLLATLDLRDCGDDRFEVDNAYAGYGERVFGGQVAAQALRAATATVTPDRRPHSLHAYFIRPGRPGVPIVLDVERTRDGRSFSTRRVLASQGDEVIFEASCSYHHDEPGVDYQLPPPGDVPDPERAPRRMLFIPESRRDLLPFELRELGRVGPDDDGTFRSTRRAWVRVRGRLPDDVVVHTCLLTYLSDLGAMYSAIAPVAELPPERVVGASLDHALWFHRPMRADEWFLFDLQAVSNAGARGLARGTMHGVDGMLGVSVAQEALIRLGRSPAPGGDVEVA